MSLAACADLVRRGDPDRFLAVMAAPVAARARLFPLLAFNLEVARAPWVSAEPLIAEMRLQWWRDALDELARGQKPRSHEVAAPLAEVIRAQGLPVDLLDQMVAARRWDIYRDGFADLASLRAHLDQTAGHLLWLSALALGALPAQEPAVRQAGLAGGIAAWLIAVPALVARGRQPLPDASLAAVRDLAQQGLAALAAARRQPPGPALPALRMVWRARPLLAQAAADPGAVAAGRLGTSEFHRRGSLIVKTALRRW